MGTRNRVIDNICSITLGFMDWVLLTRPRIWNVGFLAYAIIYLWILLSGLVTVIVGVTLTIYDVVLYVLILLFVGFSIGYIGSVVVSKLDYVKCGNEYMRRIRCIIYNVVSSIFYNKEKPPRYGAKLQLLSFALSIFFPQLFLVLTIMGSSRGAVIRELMLGGSPAGLAAFIIVAVLHVFVAFFWLYTTSAIAYILWIHSWILGRVSHAIEMELSGVNSLSLERVLANIMARDRPALEFVKFRSRLLGITDTLVVLMKRLLIIMIIYVVGSIIVGISGGGIDLLGLVIVIVALILLSIPIVYTIYSIYKWSSELNRLIIVEIKNMRLGFYRRDDMDMVKVSEEIEALVKELGHTMLSSREVWELLAALFTLIATLIAIVARFHVY